MQAFVAGHVPVAVAPPTTGALLGLPPHRGRGVRRGSRGPSWLPVPASADVGSRSPPAGPAHRGRMVRLFPSRPSAACHSFRPLKRGGWFPAWARPLSSPGGTWRSFVLRPCRAWPFLPRFRGHWGVHRPARPAQLESCFNRPRTNLAGVFCLDRRPHVFDRSPCSGSVARFSWSFKTVRPLPDHSTISGPMYLLPAGSTKRLAAR